MTMSLNGYVNLLVEAPNAISPPCHDWWPLVYCKREHEVSNLSLDLTKPRH